MRAFPSLLALFAFATLPALAQEPAGSPAPKPPQPAAEALPSDHAGRLDALFLRLKREEDPARAETLANQIQAEWQDSGSATTDLLMQRAASAVASKNMAAALDLLDQAIVLQPAFPEPGTAARPCTMPRIATGWRRPMSRRP